VEDLGRLILVNYTVSVRRKNLFSGKSLSATLAFKWEGDKKLDFEYQKASKHKFVKISEETIALVIGGETTNLVTFDVKNGEEKGER